MVDENEGRGGRTEGKEREWDLNRMKRREEEERSKVEFEGRGGRGVCSQCSSEVTSM